MPSHVVERLQKRAHAVRTRATIRAWQYRQRHLAGGTWFRVRRVLAGARTAFIVSEDDARRLVTEGYAPEPCGHELSPAKTIVFVDEARLATIATRREIPPRLSADLLEAPAVALLRWPDAER